MPLVVEMILKDHSKKKVTFRSHAVTMQPQVSNYTRSLIHTSLCSKTDVSGYTTINKKTTELSSG